MYEDMPMLEPKQYQGPFVHMEGYMEHWERVERERYERSKQPVKKAADTPVFSSDQCAICHRSVQPTEALIRDGGRVAHAACVQVLVDLINAGKRKGFVPESNLDAVRESVRDSEEAMQATNARLARALSTITRFLHK